MEKENIGALSFVLDVGPDAVKIAKRFIEKILDKKMKEKSRDEVCLVQFGAAGTVSPTADVESHKNITIAWPLGTVDMDFVQHIEASSGSGDCLDAVMKAMDHVTEAIQGEKKEFASRKLFLLTDLGRKYTFYKIGGVVAAIKNSETKLVVIYLHRDKTSQVRAREELLRTILEIVNGSFYSFSVENERASYCSGGKISWGIRPRRKLTNVGAVPGLDDFINFFLDCEKEESEEKPHQIVLDMCLPELVTTLDVKRVLKYIQEYNILDDLTLRDISADNEVKELITQIRRRDKDTYEKFKECLAKTEQTHLKYILEEGEKREIVKWTDMQEWISRHEKSNIPKEEAPTFVQGVEEQNVEQPIDKDNDKEPVLPVVGAEAAPPIQEKHGEGSMPKDEVQAVEEQNVEQSMDEDKDKEPVPDEVAPDGGAEAEATPPIEGKLHRNVLNRCLPALVRNIDFQMVSMYMLQNKVIDEVHHLSEKKTESDKIRELIARIQEKDKDTYEEFKECLVKARQSYLKDMLEEHEKIETHRCTVNLSDTKDRSATKIEESDERADKKGHVMISYSLDQKEKSLWIKTQLENNGYTVWIDEENMHDSIADAMERAHVVVLCMSETYNSSVNCQKVALYRNGKRKVIIPLKMEDFTPHGFLESLVMDNIYYNFCGKSPSEDEMKKLLQELASYYIKDLEEPKIVPFDSTIVLDDRVPVPSATPPIQVETSVLSEIIMSLRIDNQDVKMTIKELEEVLAAGPDDAKAPRIVDSILEQGDEKLKTLVLKHLAKLLKTEMASVEEHTNFMIWPATKLSQGETIFVCLHKDKLKTKLKSFFNIAIFYKNTDSPSPLIDLKNPEDLKWTVPAEEDALLIQSVIEEHGDRLYSVHSNLQVICGGPFLLHERQQLVEKKTTIILYCNAKGYKPYGEKEFPSFLAYAGKDIQVDVREGNFALATGNEEWHETLCMGISIGIEDDVNFSGTLGPIVNFEDWYGFITCAHVVGTNETCVVQPADGNLGGTKTKEQKICGSVEKWVFNSAGLDRRNGLVKVVGVDAALVKLNKTRPVTLPPKFPPIPREELSKIEGVDPERELQYTGDIEVSEESQRFIGKTVIKYGKTSGFRRGHVDLEGAMVKIPVHQYSVLYKMWNNETFLMRGVYVINRIGPKQFAEEGDSGAGIFLIENDKLTLIGLVIGVLNATYDHRCLATPIEYVLRTLNVKKNQLQVVEKDSNK